MIASLPFHSLASFSSYCGDSLEIGGSKIGKRTYGLNDREGFIMILLLLTPYTGMRGNNLEDQAPAAMITSVAFIRFVIPF